MQIPARWSRTSLSRNVFFIFFGDVSHDSYGFAIIFGRVASKNALETYETAWGVPQKVEKTSGDSLGGLGGSWQLLATFGAPGRLWKSSGTSPESSERLPI